MIRCQWFRELEGKDLEDAQKLVREAAEYDDEAGFSRIDAELVAARGSGGDTLHHHLLVRGWLDQVPRERGEPHLVAYLHLAVSGRDAAGEARLVVHPDFRSLGVATMLVEEVGLDVAAPGGWSGTGATSLRGWALGHHPAAERLTRRFGIAEVTRTWQMARHLTGPFARDLPEAPLPADLAIVSAAEIKDPPAAVEEVCRDGGMAEAYRRRLALSMRDDAGPILFAVDGEARPAGFVWLDTEIRRVEGLRTGAVRAMATSAGWRRSGVGLALMVRGLSILRDAGAQVAATRVDPEEKRAVRLTRLLSFERVQDDVCYAVGPVPAAAIDSLDRL